jgi:hypothetical protein
MAVAAAIESGPVQLKSAREDIKELLRTGRGSPDVLPVTNMLATCLHASDSNVSGQYVSGSASLGTTHCLPILVGTVIRVHYSRCSVLFAACPLLYKFTSGCAETVRF